LRRVDGDIASDHPARPGVRELYRLLRRQHRGAYSGRTANYIMFATLPVTETRSRVFILNAVSQERARRLPAFLLPLILEITHRLTLAFLHADIAVINQLQYKFGILLPDSDAAFIGWLRYYNSLPAAALLETGAANEALPDKSVPVGRRPGPPPKRCRPA
jgi:hypothetical protein